MRERPAAETNSLHQRLKSCRARGRLLFLAIGAASAALACGLARAGEAEMERFRTEYPPALERLERAYAESKGECEAFELPGRGARRRAIAGIRFESSGGFRKASIRENEGNEEPYDQVFVHGDAEAFSILKPIHDSTFKISSINDPRRTKGSYDNEIGRALDAPYSAFLLPMSRILKFPTYRLRSAESFNRAGKTLMRVRLTFGSLEQPQPVVLELDPASCWAIVRSEFHVREGAGNAGAIVDVEYGPLVDGVPTLNSVKIADSMSRPDAPIKFYEFGQFEFGSTPPEEFTLARYSLTDISPSRSGFRQALAFGLPALALAGAGLALVWRGLSRRRKLVV